MKIYSSKNLCLQNFKGNLIPVEVDSKGYIQFEIDPTHSHGDSFELAKAMDKDINKGKNITPLNFDEPQIIYHKDRGQYLCHFNSQNSKINLDWRTGDNVTLSILPKEGFFQAPLGKDVWTKETTNFFKSLLTRIISNEDQTHSKKFNDDLFDVCVKILKRLEK